MLILQHKVQAVKLLVKTKKPTGKKQAYQVIVNSAEVSLGFYPGFTFGGVAGYSYIIQSSTNLVDTNAWLTLTNLALSQPVELWLDTIVDASSSFESKDVLQDFAGAVRINCPPSNRVGIWGKWSLQKPLHATMRN